MTSLQKRCRKSIVLVLMAVIGLLLAASLTLFAADTGTISGKITDASTSAGVAGATVKCSDGTTATTDQNGNYTLTVNAPAQLDSIRVSQDNYWPGTALSIQVAEGQTTNVDFALTPLVSDSTKAVKDTFSRADSSDLGTTEDSQAYTWDPTPDDGEAISNGQLVMTGGGADTGASLTGFSAADVDITFTGTMTSKTGSVFDEIGVAYRGTTPHKRSGYAVWFGANYGDNGTVMLQYQPSDVALASASLKGFDITQPHQYHIRALGNHHQVWLDGNLLIDCWDTRTSAVTTPGVFMLYHTFAAAAFDDLTVQPYVRQSVPTTVSGKVVDSADPSLGIAGATINLSSGGSIVTDAQGNYSVVLNISEPVSIDLNVSADGYWDGSVTNVAVYPGENQSRNIALDKIVFAPSDVVTDHFNRADNTDLGTTESPNEYAWVKAAGDTEQILNNELLEHGGSDCGASIPDFYAADFDATFNEKLADYSSSSFDVWTQCGIAYRGYSTDRKSGYQLAFLPKMDGGVVMLQRNGVELIRKAIAGVDFTQYREVRVKAIGNRHQLWLDGTQIWDYKDTSDSAINGSGFFMFFHTRADAMFDDISITRFVRGTAKITGKVIDSQTSAPIAGAKVLLNGSISMLTDANGNYEFDRIADGDNTISASSEGYWDNSVTVTISAGGDQVKDVPLDKVVVLQADVVTDHFDRFDNMDLGTTEDPNAYLWVKAAGDTEQILGNELYEQGGSDCGASISGFYAADFDTTFKEKLADYSDPSYDIWTQCGISYRSHNFDKKSGYQLAFLPKLDGGVVLLQRDGTELIRKGIAGVDFTQYREVRVKASGNRHQLWLDGTQLWDYYDTDNSAINGSGFFMFFHTRADAMFDDISITRFAKDTGKKITGKIFDAMTSAPIAGARVILNGRDSALTDANGIYEFDRVTAGDYAISASKADEGYDARQVSVNFPEDQSIVIRNIGLLKASDLPTTAVYDTFSRDYSDVLGTTEDDNHIPWVQTADGNPAQVYGDMLELAPSSVDDGVYLGGGFAPADFDMTFSMAWNILDPDLHWGGFTYRQPTAGLGSGYRMVITSEYKAKLLRGTTEIASKDIIGIYDPYSGGATIEVKAVGDHHQMYIGGSLVLDTFDSGTINGGFVGFVRDSGNDVFVDDFNMAVYQFPTCTITGKVTDAKTGNAVAGATVSVLGQSGKTAADGVYSISVTAMKGDIFIGDTVNFDWKVVASDYLTKTMSTSDVLTQTYTQDFAITPLPAPCRIRDAKNAAKGTDVYVKNLVVTAKFKDCYYVEDVDRTCGVKVTGADLAVNDNIDLYGIVNGGGAEEKYIAPIMINKIGSKTIAPLGSAGRSFSGVSGQSIAGLLMKTWGKVTFKDTNGNFVYVDDGSGLNDGSGHAGLKVDFSKSYDVSMDTAVNEGDNVAIAGIVGSEAGSAVILARSGMDISNALDTYVIAHPSDLGIAWSGDNAMWESDVNYSSEVDSTITDQGLRFVESASNNWNQAHFRGADGIKLSDLKVLRYGEFINSQATDQSNLTLSIKLWIDVDNDGESDQFLIYEPWTNGFNGVPGTWQTWDALNDGKWWSIKADWTERLVTPENAKPLSDYISQYPDAKIAADYDGNILIFAMDLGSPSANFDVTLGSLTVGTSTGTTVYSFSTDTAQ